jgi:hypothetical protein
MYYDLNEEYKYQVTYCFLKVLYDECKWWQFTRKKIIKEQLDWVYPLMRNEVKFIKGNRV